MRARVGSTRTLVTDCLPCADSIQPTSVLRCGHTLHEHCFQEMQQNNQTSCPVCMKSFANMQPVRCAPTAPVRGVCPCSRQGQAVTSAPTTIPTPRCSPELFRRRSILNSA